MFERQDVLMFECLNVWTPEENGGRWRAFPALPVLNGGGQSVTIATQSAWMGQIHRLKYTGWNPLEAWTEQMGMSKRLWEELEYRRQLEESEEERARRLADEEMELVLRQRWEEERGQGGRRIA